MSTLVHGLERLEYRGYDSAGLIAFAQDDYLIKKTIGGVEELSQDVKYDTSGIECFSGIAHTRWATHGGVTTKNCHPHLSNDGLIAVVHNGIIENYSKLKHELETKGYIFSSETDTEVISNLMQEHWSGDLAETVQNVSKLIRGAYAILVVHAKDPTSIVGAKLGSPLMFGYKDDEYFFSSDAQAMSGYAEKLIYLEDGDILSLKESDFIIISGGKPTMRNVEDLDQEKLEASKGTFKHFMIKEIFEQPIIAKRIYKGRVDFENATLTADAFHGMQHDTIRDITLVACGTSHYSSQLGGLWFENISKIPTRSMIASEYENRPSFIRNGLLHIFVSQSGETADTIEILKQVIDEGGKTLGVVNVPGSTIARLTDSGLFTRAGTEIGVASTKAFLGQSLCLLLSSLYLGKKNGMLRAHYKQIIHELQQLPMYIDTILDQSEYIRSIAEQLVGYKRFFFLGRGYNVPIAFESALKLKEISYITSEGYPAGELKHGALALIDDETPSVLFAPNDDQLEKNISSMHEIKARNGKVLVVSDKNLQQADWYIQIPPTIKEIYPFLNVVVGQLLAYHIADVMGRPIDKPRNLAKSVTVK